MTSSVPMNGSRSAFFKDAAAMESEAFFRKWFPDTIIIKCYRFIRHTLMRLHLYRPIKRMAKKILGR